MSGKDVSQVAVFGDEPEQSTTKSIYAPLDFGTHSIRLIQVQPELSSNGLIQCNIQIGSIENTYTCLSYVWGAEPAERTILIRGIATAIRPNLHDFLHIARRRYHDRWLWIDALCINQSNETERNHQVQQMGKIYTQAEEVLSWLGTDEEIARCLEPGDAPSAMEVLAFKSSPYWRRAWITQEVVLAQRLTLLAGCNAMLLDRAAERMSSPWRIHYDTRHASTHADYFMPNPTTWANEKGKDLIILLIKFATQQCEAWQDRVYSLLALCSDPQSIRVDYSIKPSELLYQLLRTSKHELCLCSVAAVARDMVVDWEDTETAIVEYRVYGASRIIWLGNICSRVSVVDKYTGSGSRELRWLSDGHFSRAGMIRPKLVSDSSGSYCCVRFTPLALLALRKKFTNANQGLCERALRAQESTQLGADRPRLRLCHPGGVREA